MSSSSSSSSQDVEGGDGGNGGGRGRGVAEFEGPSSSRRRSNNGVWPAPFVEALASQVAIDAAGSVGRLAAAPALANLFQVCSTWRAVSRADHPLWQNLTRRIWNRNRLIHDTWRDEYIYRHRTAQNFFIGRYIYGTLHFLAADDDNDGLSCRRLALSDHHLAAGFSDGSVRLFHLPTRLHLSNFYPQPRDRIGHFATAISGIVLSDTHLIFATLDGDIHVVTLNNAAPLRRSRLGLVVEDGPLVDFTGCDRWWVGLFSGSPGRAFHIWDANTEELIFVGGTLTDDYALTAWRLLDDLTEFIARVRVTTQESAVACTSLRVIVFDLRNQGIVLGEQEFQREVIVGSFDANHGSFVIVNNRGVASVRRVGTLELVCRFRVGGGALLRDLLGCMNAGYALMCVGGVVRVWEVEHGGFLYNFGERIGEATALVVDDRHVAASSSDGTIHLWDFGAQ